MSRDNTSLTIFPSASRAIVSKSTDFVNVGYNSAIFHIDWIAASSDADMGPTFAVQARAAGTTAARYNTIATVGTTNSTSTGIRRIIIHPGVSTAYAAPGDIVEQEVVNAPLPRVFRVTSTAASTGTCQFSVGVDLLNS